MATAQEKMRRRRQSVVSAIEMVPENYIRLAQFGTRPRGKRGSDNYEILLDAYQRGEIDACKLMRTPRDKAGPVFVDATQAAALIDAEAGRVSELERGKRVRSERIASAADAVRMLHEQIGRLLVQAVRLEMDEGGR